MTHSIFSNQFGFVDAVVYLGNGTLFISLLVVTVPALISIEDVAAAGALEIAVFLPLVYLSGFLFSSLSGFLSGVFVRSDGDDTLFLAGVKNIVSGAFIPGVGQTKSTAIANYHLYVCAYGHRVETVAIALQEGADKVAATCKMDLAAAQDMSDLAARHFCLAGSDVSGVPRLGVLRRFISTSMSVLLIIMCILAYALLTDNYCSLERVLMLGAAYVLVLLLLANSLCHVEWDEYQAMAEQGLGRLLGSGTTQN